MVGIGGQQIYVGSKSWQEDIYWTHFQFIHFTQFLTTDFQQQLALPKTFSNNVKKKLPENATLKGPSGVVWNIGLTTKDDIIYFSNGWQQFLKDHSLKENDFLVFKYNGESHFEVLIFDGESFCEKAASYFVGKCGHTQTEQGDSKAKETNNSVEEINTASNGGVDCGSPEKYRRLNNIRTPLAVPFETTNGETFNAGVESASPEKLMADALTKTKTIQFPFQPTGKRTKKPVNEVTPTPVQKTKKRGRPFKAAHSCDLAGCNKENSEASILNRSGKEDEHHVLSSGASLSRSSVCHEKKIAQSFSSTFPYFVKIMKSFNVGGSRILNIPSKFSKAHLPNSKIQIILHNLKGEKWTVNAVPTTKLQTSHTMCGGWLDFVRGNKVKVGDVCIFELIGECELRVRIAEVGKDGLEDSQVGKQASSMPSARHAVARHKTSSSRYKSKSSKFSSKHRKKVVASDKKLSKIGQEAVSSIELKKPEVGKEGLDNQNGHVTLST